MAAAPARRVRFARLPWLVLCGFVCAVTVVGCDPVDPVRPGKAHAQAPAEDEQPSTNLPCFLAADERTMLRDPQALRLCVGSNSTGPVQCFERAKRQTTLSDNEAIQLCRCARGVRPVRCFRQFVGNPRFTDDFLVLQCSPVVRRKLNGLCIPLERL
jgi:hypothetical protein